MDEEVRKWQHVSVFTDMR